MISRILSAVVGFAILVAIVLLDRVWIFNLAVACIAMIGLSEVYGAFRAKGVKPVEFVGYLVVGLLAFVSFANEKAFLSILLFLFPICLLVLFGKSIFDQIKTNIIDISATILGILYVGGLFLFLILTNQMENGNYYIWFIFGGAWATDIFAYLIGITIGKHKFSKISPKKSIEGCIGGVIGCILFFVGYTYFLGTKGIILDYTSIIIFSILVSIISQIGDFAASTIKRYCEIKDYGTILPGHGGIMDRFDSMLLIAPVIYAYFQIFIR